MVQKTKIVQTQQVQQNVGKEGIVSRARMNWQATVGKMFQGFGFSQQEQIPDKVRDEIMKEDTRLVAGRNIGTMEMIKARREYRGKRATAQKRLNVVESHISQLEKEESAINLIYERKRLNKDGEEETYQYDVGEKRDFMALMHLLPAEEQQAFVDGYASENPEEGRIQLDKAIQAFENSDFSVLQYKNDDDLFDKDKYAKRMLLAEAGWIMKNMLKEYFTRGGTMDEVRYQALLNKVDLCSQVRTLYEAKKDLLLHPQHMMLREGDLQGLGLGEIINRQTRVAEEISRLRNAIRDLQEGDPQIATLQKRVERLQNLSRYLSNMERVKRFSLPPESSQDQLERCRQKIADYETANQKIREKYQNPEDMTETDRKAIASNNVFIKNNQAIIDQIALKERLGDLPMLQPGEDVASYLQKTAERRKTHHILQWHKNLKELFEQNEKEEALRLRLMTHTVDGQHIRYFEPTDVANGATFRGAGINDRFGTQTNMIRLIYMHRTGKTLDQLYDLKPEEWQELESIRDELFGTKEKPGKILSQKPIYKGVDEKQKDIYEQRKEDVENMAAIYHEMVLGYIQQFSALQGKSMYKAFIGISDMEKDSVTTGTTAFKEGWGKVASLNLQLGAMHTDLNQIAQSSPLVVQLALSKLSKEELARFLEVQYYMGNVSIFLEGFFNDASLGDTPVLKKKEDVTEELVGHLMEESFPVQSYEHLSGSFQSMIMSLRSFGMEDTINGRSIQSKKPAFLRGGMGDGFIGQAMMAASKDGSMTIKECLSEMESAMRGSAQTSRDKAVLHPESFYKIKIVDGVVPKPEGY